MIHQYCILIEKLLVEMILDKDKQGVLHHQEYMILKLLSILVRSASPQSFPPHNNNNTVPELPEELTDNDGDGNGNGNGKNMRK